MREWSRDRNKNTRGRKNGRRRENENEEIRGKKGCKIENC